MVRKLLKTTRLALVGVALAATALVTAPVANTHAQGNMGSEPAVVISIASIDEHLDDTRHVMRAAGMPALGDVVAGMAGQYTQPFSTKEPAGAYLILNGFEPLMVVFVPVNDLDGALDLFRNEVGDIEEIDGMTVISMPDGNEVYIKEADGYAFFSDNAENLDDLPSDPTGMLEGLHEQYNVAIRVYAQNVPDPMKQMAIGFMEEGFEDAIAGLEAIDPDAAAMQRRVNRMSMQSMIEMIEQTDQLTVGLAIDEDSKSTYLDFTITAIPGSKLAEQVRLLEGARSSFAGFLVEGAAANMNFISKVTEDDIDVMNAMFSEMQESIFEQIAREANLGPMEEELVRDVVDTVTEVMLATIEAGTMDAGAAVVLNDETVAIAAGMRVAEGDQLEELLLKLVDMAEREAPPEVDFNMNAEEYAGASMHVITVKLPEFEDEAREIFGDEVKIVIGTGDDVLYFAAGRNSMSLLKQCIDASSEMPTGDMPTGQFNLALAPIMNFVASVDSNPIAMMMADTLDGTDGDRISIYSTIVENGAQTRIVIEDGVIKLIGTAAAQFGGGFGAGF